MNNFIWILIDPDEEPIMAFHTRCDGLKWCIKQLIVKQGLVDVEAYFDGVMTFDSNAFLKSFKRLKQENKTSTDWNDICERIIWDNDVMNETDITISDRHYFLKQCPIYGD